MVQGYMGKILRVNLSEETTSIQDLPGEKVLRKFVGCWGLGLRLLYDEIPWGISPTDPRNPLIFMTGPVTGTPTPGGNNASIATLNFDTGFTAGRSHSHGIWGPQLKFAGYDGIFVTGAAKRPVYLWVHDGKAEIRDATSIWGKDTHDGEDLVKQEIGEAKASVAVIGPAGENLCHGAMIANDKNHSFSHSGVGAVMGSKKLKAIAVYGTSKVPVANQTKHNEVRRKWTDVIRKGPFYALAQEGAAGFTSGYEQGLAMGLVGKNWTATSLEGFGPFTGHKVTRRTCFACPIGCPYDIEIQYGPHKGYVATLCGGAEGLEGAGSVLGITEREHPGSVPYLTDLFDRYGLEASTIGCAIALAIECYEKGLLTKDETDGLELKWGDPEVVETLLRRIATREGFGDVLARGPKGVAETIGGDAYRFAIHTKGSGINLHDWKSGMWGVWFGQIVSGGSGWTAFADMGPEPDAGYPTTILKTHKGKPEEVRKTGLKKYWGDCLGTCVFTLIWCPTLALSVEALSAVTGWDFTEGEALTVGERVMNLERAFNVRLGLTPQDDYEAPPRLLEAPADGQAKGMTLAPYVKGMVMEYYRLMGWDEKTGKPRRETLERLGLDDTVEGIWGVRLHA